MQYFRSLSFAAVALLSLSTVAKADTIGNPAISASQIDTCGSCDYILNQAFTTAGETVENYTFYASQAGNLTPVLFTEATIGGDDFFTVTGVGTAQTVTTTGAQTYSFGLTSGSDVTGANTYFGFFSSAPTVAFSYDGGIPSVYFSSPGDTTVGTTIDGGENSVILTNELGGVNGRDYSINATAVTPEPASLSLMGLGLAGISAIVKRRRRSA